MGAVLGRGAFGVVHEATCNLPGVPNHVAVKVLSKTKLGKKREFKRVGRRVTVTTALDKAQAELAILKQVTHKHVVRCYEIIDDPDADDLYLGALCTMAQAGVMMETHPRHLLCIAMLVLPQCWSLSGAGSCWIMIPRLGDSAGVMGMTWVNPLAARTFATCCAALSTVRMRSPRCLWL